MIAFTSSNVIDVNGFKCDSDEFRDHYGENFLLSVKTGNGYCISKILAMIGIPRQFTIFMVLESQADIVAIPELYSSVYVPWRSGHRVRETAQAFLHAGMCEPIACCVAIAIDIIYDVIDRDFVDYSGTAKDCVFTSCGMMELNEESRERIFSNDHVLSELRPEKDGGLPF